MSGRPGKKTLTLRASVTSTEASARTCPAAVREALLSGAFAMQPACPAPPANESAADAKFAHGFEVPVLLPPSARERLRSPSS
jgi:hypothetical protein